MGLFPEKMYEGVNWRRKHGEPQNRRQLFQCVFTEQFFSLIPVNLLYLVFWLPAVIWSCVCLLQIVSAMQMDDGITVLSTLNVWTVGLIPCLTVIGPARAGMALLMRNWAREDYTPVLPTFWRGMRDNWKQTLLPSLLTASLPLALWLSYRIAGGVGFSGGSGILFAVVCVAAALWLLAMQVYYVLLVTYDLRMRDHLRNSVLLLFLKLPTFVLVRVGCLFFVLLFIGFTLLQPSAGYKNLLIPVIYYSTVGLATTELAYASFANKLRDDYLNREETE